MQRKVLKLKTKGKVKNKFYNNENGITLIALVITIIVLLILAGVSISMLTGQNGILTQAQNAKTTAEQASAKEKVELAVTGAIGQTKERILTVENLKIELENYKGTVEGDTFPVTAKVDGKNFLVNVNGKVLSEKNSTLGIVTGNETNNTTVKDSLGNQVVVPAGFKVVNPNDNVIDGIVVEDVSHETTVGSQFVWIPVGDVIKDSTGNKETITLGRYNFDNNGNATTYSVDYSENTSSNHNSSYGNTIAKDIEDFKNRATINNGYYIGRYEARDKVTTEARTSSSSRTNQVVCTANNYVYNYITQPQAAELSREIYSDSNFESDLMNSYAWDTAVYFWQTFDNRANKDSLKIYSRQNSLNTSLASQGTNKLESGKQDVICNVYDMASNCYEWTTETYRDANYPCTRMGGIYNDSTSYTSGRGYDSTSSNYNGLSFRILLYM